MLVVLDGFGYRKERSGNAIAQAKMPFWNALCSTHRSSLLKASGPDVGLLPGYVGNSEVGHLTLGAGRVVPSILALFNKALDDKTFFQNKMLTEKFLSLKASGKALHLMGLLSDAGVHSHTYHLQGLLQLAHQLGLEKVYIHAFLDGRDTPPFSAKKYLSWLEDFCHQLGCGTIASIHGRFYAMDRDNNWDRIQKSYDLLCGMQHLTEKKVSWQEAVDKAYHSGMSDEFMLPELLNPDGVIQPGDGIVFFNVRPDRAQQLTESFINPLFKHFKNRYNTGNQQLAFFVTTTRYKKNFAAFNNDILFQNITVKNTLLDEIAQQNTQPPPIFITAETEKFAHVTYFFRGMEETQLPHENRVIIPSIKAKDYVQHPEMSAPLITSTLIHSLRSNPAYFYLVNYANADMVGHSGNFAATVKACEILDQQLALLYHEVIERLDGLLVITADHGNAEEKIDEFGSPLTAHTTNPVPFVLVTKKKNRSNLAKQPFEQEPVFGLAHVAPTILKFMNLTVPLSMEQKTIF